MPARWKALPSGPVVGMHGTGIITEHQVSVHYMALYLAVDVTLNQPCISTIFWLILVDTVIPVPPSSAASLSTAWLFLVTLVSICANGALSSRASVEWYDFIRSVSLRLLGWWCRGRHVESDLWRVRIEYNALRIGRITGRHAQKMPTPTSTVDHIMVVA